MKICDFYPGGAVTFGTTCSTVIYSKHERICLILNLKHFPARGEIKDLNGEAEGREVVQVVQVSCPHYMLDNDQVTPTTSLQLCVCVLPAPCVTV